MEKTISLRFNYTEEEYIAATRLHLGHSRDLMIRMGVIFFYSLGCIALFMWLDFASALIPLLIIAGCLPLLMGFLLFYVIPRQRFRSDPKFKDEYFLQFSDDGIQFKTTDIDALLQWSLYDKVLENERFYLLVCGKNMISVIPKRTFADAHQEAAFSQMLRRNLPAYANAKRLQEHQSDAPPTAYVPPAEPPDWR